MLLAAASHQNLVMISHYTALSQLWLLRRLYDPLDSEAERVAVEHWWSMLQPRETSVALAADLARLELLASATAVRVAPLVAEALSAPAPCLRF